MTTCGLRSDDSKNKQKQEQKQIPPLRCGMTSKGGLRNDKQKRNAGVPPLRYAPVGMTEVWDGSG
jgi:hypothetical protein